MSEGDLGDASPGESAVSNAGQPSSSSDSDSDSSTGIDEDDHTDLPEHIGRDTSRSNARRLRKRNESRLRRRISRAERELRRSFQSFARAQAPAGNAGQAARSAAEEDPDGVGTLSRMLEDMIARSSFVVNRVDIVLAAAVEEALHSENAGREHSMFDRDTGTAYALADAASVAALRLSLTNVGLELENKHPSDIVKERFTVHVESAISQVAIVPGEHLVDITEGKHVHPDDRGMISSAVVNEGITSVRTQLSVFERQPVLLLLDRIGIRVRFSVRPRVFLAVQSCQVLAHAAQLARLAAWSDAWTAAAAAVSSASARTHSASNASEHTDEHVQREIRAERGPGEQQCGPRPLGPYQYGVIEQLLHEELRHILPEDIRSSLTDLARATTTTGGTENSEIRRGNEQELAVDGESMSALGDQPPPSGGMLEETNPSVDEGVEEEHSESHSPAPSLRQPPAPLDESTSSPRGSGAVYMSPSSSRDFSPEDDEEAVRFFEMLPEERADAGKSDGSPATAPAPSFGTIRMPQGARKAVEILIRANYASITLPLHKEDCSSPNERIEVTISPLRARVSTLASLPVSELRISGENVSGTYYADSKQTPVTILSFAAPEVLRPAWEASIAQPRRAGTPKGPANQERMDTAAAFAQHAALPTLSVLVTADSHAGTCVEVESVYGVVLRTPAQVIRSLLQFSAAYNHAYARATSTAERPSPATESVDPTRSEGLPCRRSTPLDAEDAEGVANALGDFCAGRCAALRDREAAGSRSRRRENARDEQAGAAPRPAASRERVIAVSVAAPLARLCFWESFACDTDDTKRTQALVFHVQNLALARAVAYRASSIAELRLCGTVATVGVTSVEDALSDLSTEWSFVRMRDPVVCIRTNPFVCGAPQYFAAPSISTFKSGFSYANAPPDVRAADDFRFAEAFEHAQRDDTEEEEARRFREFRDAVEQGTTSVVQCSASYAVLSCAESEYATLLSRFEQLTSCISSTSEARTSPVRASSGQPEPTAARPTRESRRATLDDDASALQESMNETQQAAGTSVFRMDGDEGVCEHKSSSMSHGDRGSASAPTRACFGMRIDRLRAELLTGPQESCSDCASRSSSLDSSGAERGFSRRCSCASDNGSDSDSDNGSDSDSDMNAERKREERACDADAPWRFRESDARLYVCDLPSFELLSVTRLRGSARSLVFVRSGDAQLEDHTERTVFPIVLRPAFAPLCESSASFTVTNVSSLGESGTCVVLRRRLVRHRVGDPWLLRLVNFLFPSSSPSSATSGTPAESCMQDRTATVQYASVPDAATAQADEQSRSSLDDAGADSAAMLFVTLDDTLVEHCPSARALKASEVFASAAVHCRRVSLWKVNSKTMTVKVVGLSVFVNSARRWLGTRVEAMEAQDAMQALDELGFVSAAHVDVYEIVMRQGEARSFLESAGNRLDLWICRDTAQALHAVAAQVGVDLGVASQKENLDSRALPRAPSSVPPLQPDHQPADSRGIVSGKATMTGLDIPAHEARERANEAIRAALDTDILAPPRQHEAVEGNLFRSLANAASRILRVHEDDTDDRGSEILAQLYNATPVSVCETEDSDGWIVFDHASSAEPHGAMHPAPSPSRPASGRDRDRPCNASPPHSPWHGSENVFGDTEHSSEDLRAQDSAPSVPTVGDDVSNATTQHGGDGIRRDDLPRSNASPPTHHREQFGRRETSDTECDDDGPSGTQMADSEQVPLGAPWSGDDYDGSRLCREEQARSLSSETALGTSGETVYHSIVPGSPTQKRADSQTFDSVYHSVAMSLTDEQDAIGALARSFAAIEGRQAAFVSPAWQAESSDSQTESRTSPAPGADHPDNAAPREFPDGVADATHLALSRIIQESYIPEVEHSEDDDIVHPRRDGRGSAHGGSPNGAGSAEMSYSVQDITIIARLFGGTDWQRPLRANLCPEYDQQLTIRQSSVHAHGPRTIRCDPASAPDLRASETAEDEDVAARRHRRRTNEMMEVLLENAAIVSTSYQRPRVQNTPNDGTTGSARAAASGTADEDETAEKYAVRIRIQRIEVSDHIATSQWQKLLLPYAPRAWHQPAHAAALAVDLSCAEGPLGRDEIQLRVSMTPVRLHIDQDALDFLVAFAGAAGTHVPRRPAGSSAHRHEAPGGTAGAESGSSAVKSISRPHGAADAEESSDASAGNTRSSEEKQRSVAGGATEQTSGRQATTASPGAEDAHAAEKVSEGAATATGKTYIKLCTVKGFIVRIDYKPKRVSYDRLRGGAYLELLNLFPLSGLELELKDIRVRGVEGFDELANAVAATWVLDITHSQLHRCIGGVRPLRSFVNVGNGMVDLVALPMQQYREDGQVLRGIASGAFSFLKTIAVETLDLTAAAAAGTQTLLEGAERGILGAAGARFESRDPGAQRSGGSRRAIQPVTAREGFRLAADSLSRGVRNARDTLVMFPADSFQRSGVGGGLSSFARAIPVAVIRPFIGMAEAMHSAAAGARNSVAPETLEQIKDKYKQRPL